MTEQSKIENPKSKIVMDSAERAGAGGQSDQVIRGTSVECRVDRGREKT
jgi:hypothetical protein